LAELKRGIKAGIVAGIIYGVLYAFMVTLFFNIVGPFFLGFWGFGGLKFNFFLLYS